MEKLQIKAIGFDYGGVIFGKPGSQFIKATSDVFGITVDEMNDIYFQHNHLVNVEGVSWKEMWKIIARDIDRVDCESDIINVIEGWAETQVVNDEIIELINNLRSQGYIIGLLSNYDDKLHKKLKDQKIDEYFDVIVTSSDIKFMKPQPEAFGAFCKLMQVCPEEMIYIDDTKKSLETANKIGYTPIYFQSYLLLCDDLKKLGVLE